MVPSRDADAPSTHDAGAPTNDGNGTCDPYANDLVHLYKATSEGLFRYALATIRERHLAEDAVQDSFLRYFLARKEGQVIPNGKAWLYRVLRNLLFDLRKRADTRLRVDMEDAGDQAATMQESETSGRWAELLKSLSSTLTAREMDCLRLRAEGLHYKEIAQVLGIRQGTVGVLLGRALKKTQKLVSPERDKGCSKG